VYREDNRECNHQNAGVRRFAGKPAGVFGTRGPGSDSVGAGRPEKQLPRRAPPQGPSHEINAKQFRE
jgi:hypothetical protein